MKISLFYNHIEEACEQSGKKIEKVLEFVEKCGIKGIEINRWDLIKKPELILELKKYNLEISCIYEFYSWEDMSNYSRLENHVQLAVENNAKKILLVPPFLDEQHSTEEILPFLKYAVEISGKQNIKVTLEDFDNEKSPCAKISQLKYLFEKIPGLYFTFDMGNFAFSNESADSAFEELKKYICHIHCKDRGFENGINFENNKGLASVPTGFGYIGIEKLVKKVLETGYDDYFAIEHFGAYDQLNYIQKSADFIKAI